MKPLKISPLMIVVYLLAFGMIAFGFFSPHVYRSIQVIALISLVLLILLHALTNKVIFIRKDQEAVIRKKGIDAVFVIVFLLCGGLVSWFPSMGTDDLNAVMFISSVMILIGNISFRLPFNASMGLRFAWIKDSQETWDVTHEFMGYTSLAVSVAFTISMLRYNSVGQGFICLAIWIGLPIIYSYFYAKAQSR